MNMHTGTPQIGEIARISHKVALWRKRALQAEGRMARLSEDRRGKRMRPKTAAGCVGDEESFHSQEENLRELALANYRDR